MDKVQLCYKSLTVVRVSTLVLYIRTVAVWLKYVMPHKLKNKVLTCLLIRTIHEEISSVLETTLMHSLTP